MSLDVLVCRHHFVRLFHRVKQAGTRRFVVDNLPSKDEIRAAYERVEKFLNSVPSIVERALNTEERQTLDALAKELSEQASHLVAPFKSLDRLRALAFNLVDPTRANIGERWGAEEVLEKASELESWLSTRGEYYSLKRELASNPPDFEKLANDRRARAREKGRILRLSASNIKSSHRKQMAQMEQTANAQPEWTLAPGIERYRQYLINEEAFLEVAILEMRSGGQAGSVSPLSTDAKPKVPQKKGSQKKGDAEQINIDDIFLELLKTHHNFRNRRTNPNFDPIKSGLELARQIDPKNPKASENQYKTRVYSFFTKHFNGFDKYKVLCIQVKGGPGGIMYKLAKMSGREPYYKPTGGNYDLNMIPDDE